MLKKTNKQGRAWHLLFQRDGFRSPPMTPKRRQESRNLQLGERLAKLSIMHQPGTMIQLTRAAYVVHNNFSWRRVPTI